MDPDESALSLSSALINLVSGHVSIRFNFRGPNHAVVTACATGAHAIGDAARLIMMDDADVMVGGGSEAPFADLVLPVSPLHGLYRPVSTIRLKPLLVRGDDDRDGFVMGEGGGCVVLEEYEHAKRRGAKIYAEITGYGLSGDAHHITAPAADGNGGFRAPKLLSSALIWPRTRLITSMRMAHRRHWAT